MNSPLPRVGRAVSAILPVGLWLTLTAVPTLALWWTATRIASHLPMLGWVVWSAGFAAIMLVGAAVVSVFTDRHRR